MEFDGFVRLLLPYVPGYVGEKLGILDGGCVRRLRVEDLMKIDFLSGTDAQEVLNRYWLGLIRRRGATENPREEALTLFEIRNLGGLIMDPTTDEVDVTGTLDLWKGRAKDPWPNNPEDELVLLLVELFSPNELRKLVEEISSTTPKVRSDLGTKWGLKHPHLAIAVVGTLKKNKRIDAEFFALLNAERPHRTEEINAVRGMFP